MPFPFTLPTTSAFSFSKHFSSDSHPSLTLSASTYRGVVRDILKKHKRLPPSEQASNLSNVQSSLSDYIPYLLAIDAGLSNQKIAGEEIDIVLRSTPILEWRPTLSNTSIPGREISRLKITSLEYEIYFAFSTLAYTYSLQARSGIHILHSSATFSLSPEQQSTAINTATKHLLTAASIHGHLSKRSESILTTSPCADISGATFKALSSLALAEATLLAVLKDDPYPGAVAQDRNRNDKDWMIKAPEIPKIRAHLFARLCLAAAEHAASALSLLNSSAGDNVVHPELVRYVSDLARAGRAKACRFIGIDKELSGATGEAIGWVAAGRYELGFEVKEEGGQKGGSTLWRLKREWAEKREDKRVEKGSAWGYDAGKLEEGRVLDMLSEKWNKMNDTVNTQTVTPFRSLIPQLPSGREIHTMKPYIPPQLDVQILERMRAPPDRDDDFGENFSDDESDAQDPVGAFPGTRNEYGIGGKRASF